MKFISVTIFSLLILNVGLLAQMQTNTIQKEKTTRIQWLTWEEAQELSKQEKRKIILDVYKEWCYWCKKMDSVTFKDPHIAQYLNDNYYVVKFDAEQKGDLIYKDKVYKYVKIGNGKRGYHQLAAELLKGRLSFPTIVFLDENMDLIQSIVGFKTPVQFEKIATYFATNNHRRTPWSTYKRRYKSVLVGGN